jgi:glycine/D-amino acid oxidase-like deaminating enzyme
VSPQTSGSGIRVVVIGAGAFGGWTALDLRRRGATVRLIEAWAPGHQRASSGGQTRVIRATYGSHLAYTKMAARALQLWTRHDAAFGGGLLRRTGALWMFGESDEFARRSAVALHANGLSLDELSIADAARRFPAFHFDDVTRVMFEPEAGYLFARRACRHVVERFVAEGGMYSNDAVAAPVGIDGDLPPRIRLASGEAVEADAIVFACGPWLGQLFPDVVGSLVASTRQEVYYFGIPTGDRRFSDERCPVWIDFDRRLVYGVPASEGGGFKIADDAPGPEMDPTTGNRAPSPDGVVAARAFLARRFPSLRDAPLIGTEVCQYESTPDANFIVDRHPRAPHVWLVGGGSGHGFKMGPAIGEIVSGLILDHCEPDPLFSLSRFATPPPGGWRPKWA